MSLSWLDWLFEAVAWVLIQIHAGLSHIFAPDSGAAWGLAIVILTICVRVLIFPLFVKQMHSMRKMQDLQPEIAKLRQKYKNDRQALNEATMKLMQERGANPLGGCLPLVFQFPIFIALFRVLQAVAAGQPKYGIGADLMASAQRAKIFGAPISAHFLSPASQLHGADPLLAKIVIGCAVLISATTTFLTVRQSSKRNVVAPDNPMARQQKLLMYLSPGFALFGLTLPVGVLIYWVTTNAWTLVQQHYIYQRYPAPGTQDQATARGATAPKDGGAGGMLGGLLKPKSPTPPPVPSDGAPKIVRRQPTRQPRSKRSGSRKR